MLRVLVHPNNATKVPDHFLTFSSDPLAPRTLHESEAVKPQTTIILTLNIHPPTPTRSYWAVPGEPRLLKLGRGPGSI